MRTAIREATTVRTVRADTEVAARDRDHARSDAELLRRTREGDDLAFAALYERHAGPALRLARQLTRSQAAAEDLVGDAFAGVLSALRNGSGPTEAFRPYLLTAVRRRSWRADRAPEDPVDPTAPGSDLDGAVFDGDGADAQLLAEAYRSLPERWQLVLWHTEVEGQSPSEIAPLLGLSAHATAALAHRARDGLREAFLQAHLREDSAPDACRSTVASLGSLVRGRAGARGRANAEAHLAGCDRCRTLHTELLDVNRALRTVIGPLVLGGAAAAYLGRSAGGTTSPGVSTVGHALARVTPARALVAGALGAMAVALLLHRTDLGTRASPRAADSAATTTATTVQDPARTTDAPATVVMPGSGGDVGQLRPVASSSCAGDLGVAVTTSAATGSTTGSPTDPANGSQTVNQVIRAVLVPAGTAGLPQPTSTGAVAPVTGALADTLRALVTGTSARGGDEPANTAGRESECVRVAPAAVLAGGPLTLLVAYLPAGSTTVDDLAFAVIARPLAFLGSTVSATLADVRAILRNGLGTVDDLTGAVSGLAGGLTGGRLDTPTLGDLLAPLTGAPLTGAPLIGAPLTGAPLTGSPLTGTPPGGVSGPAGGSAVPPPPAPAVTLPPTPAPTLPRVTVPPLPPVTVPPLPSIPNVTPPSLPLPGLPLG